MWQGDIRKQQELYNDALVLQILIVPEQSCWITSYLETSITLGRLIHNHIRYFIKNNQQSLSSLVIGTSIRLTN